MNHCKQCIVTVPIYEVRIEGEENLHVLQTIEQFLKTKGITYNAHTNICLAKETVIQDLYNFSVDHLNVKQMFYRIESQEEWQSFEHIAAALETSWVDNIIMEQRVVCWAQPIVDSYKQVYAHEILARFFGEDGKIVAPSEVFAAAKARNRLYALDKICRMEAIKQAVYLPQKVFINFIPTSIYSPEHCLKSSIALSKKLGFQPSKFVFEVVESEYVEDLSHLKQILQYYREKGFHYALDDVGEGFNTIDVLKEIQPQYMKLDKSFVQGVAQLSSKQEVAINLLHSAQEVGAVPLAEGIECEEDFLWLKQIGFKLFQGYWFGKPEPIVTNITDVS